MKTVVACCVALLAASCAASPLPDDGVEVKFEPAASSEVEMDAQIAGLIQQIEQLQGLTPREKRAVSALLGGGGGGSFLNELNKGPTYSQLLGNSGGGFGSKLGIFSSLLGSSSGGGLVELECS
ncbi:uncharacterized protein LOC117646201 [Thrips palmi]|uniref:Uncharacterized protein LOC117646201 n=1 Tax=Thrips palmi TaxID=161013 RepID=A0A6P8ZNT2_THRPL|nr:uncharacterized protein LOC117646201 [Thrips palmi]